MFKVFVFSIIYFITSTRLLSQENTHIDFKILYGSNLLFPISSNIQLNGIGTGVTLELTKDVDDEISLSAGLGFYFICLNQYKSSISYVSNWIGGPEYSEVNLKTSLSQFNLLFPIRVNWKITEKVTLVTGVNCLILLQSKISQNVQGYYVIDKYNVSNSDWERFNQSIAMFYNRDNQINTYSFNKTNPFPVVGFIYQLSNRISTEINFAIPIKSITNNDDLYLEDFSLSLINFGIDFKILKK